MHMGRCSQRVLSFTSALCSPSKSPILSNVAQAIACRLQMAVLGTKPVSPRMYDHPDHSLEDTEQNRELTEEEKSLVRNSDLGKHLQEHPKTADDIWQVNTIRQSRSRDDVMSTLPIPIKNIITTNPTTHTHHPHDGLPHPA